MELTTQVELSRAALIIDALALTDRTGTVVKDAEGRPHSFLPTESLTITKEKREELINTLVDILTTRTEDASI